MKTQLRLINLLPSLLLFLFFLNACKEEEGMKPSPDGEGEIVEIDGIAEDDLKSYEGDIGFIVEARKVAKKGYAPAKAKITVNASSGDYSETLDLDPFSLMTQIKIPVENLSDEAISELTNGVEVVAELLDANNNAITEEVFSKVSFKANPAVNAVNGDELEDLDTQVHLKSNTPYYVQIVEEGVPARGAMVLNGKPAAFGQISLSGNISFTGDEDRFLFSFEQIPDKENTFAIRHIATNKYLRIHRNYHGIPGIFLISHAAVVADLNWQFPDDFLKGNTDAQFVIKKEGDGVYYFESVQGERIKVAAGVGLTLNYPGATPVDFRFVPMNIDWEVENIETQYLEPILPPAKSGFGYNSTLVNCGTGNLEQTIGESKTLSTITTVGWQETLSLSSSHTAYAEVTLGMEVEGSFFGLGASYSAEATAGYEYTTTSTTENSKWQEATGETSETFFSERTVTIPPKSSSLVYDAFQSYDNVKVNTVQRLRVRGIEHDTRESLSGEEIKSQFHFNGFNGMITEVGSDYIEITLRAVATMNKIFKWKSEVQEVDPMCSN